MTAFSDSDIRSLGMKLLEDHNAATNRVLALLGDDFPAQWGVLQLGLQGILGCMIANRVLAFKIPIEEAAAEVLLMVLACCRAAGTGRAKEFAKAVVAVGIRHGARPSADIVRSLLGED